MVQFARGCRELKKKSETPTPVHLETKRLTLLGYKPSRVASKINVSESMVYRYIKDLVKMGELVPIKGTKSPRLFEDGNPSSELVQFRRPDVEKIPDKVQTTMGYSQFELCGYSRRVRSHCTGGFRVRVFYHGKLSKISDENGYTIGGLKYDYDLGLNKETTVYKGHIIVDSIRTTVRAFHPKREVGISKLVIYPDEVWLPYENCVEETKRFYIEHVNKILDVFEKHGWSFDRENMKNAKFHYGGLAPELLMHADFDEEYDDSSVHCDRSNGTPEIEIYDDNPNAQEHINVLFELPERVLNLESDVAEMKGAILGVKDVMFEMKDMMLEMKGTLDQFLPILKMLFESQVQLGLNQKEMTKNMAEMQKIQVELVKAYAQRTVMESNPAYM